jgi:hypothetical protein
VQITKQKNGTKIRDHGVPVRLGSSPILFRYKDIIANVFHVPYFLAFAEPSCPVLGCASIQSVHLDRKICIVDNIKYN